MAGCGLGVRSRPELRWIGSLTPVSNASQCPPTRGVLVLRENQVAFAPDEGTWVLTGTARPGRLEASRRRRTAEHKDYDTRLEARWTETAVEGTYTTPRCTYRVALTAR